MRNHTHPLFPSALTHLPVACTHSNHGLKLDRLCHNESGDGKTALDAHFGVVSGKVTEAVNAGADAKSPSQLYTAIARSGARNTHAALLELPTDTTQGALDKLEQSKIIGSSVVREVEYIDNAGAPELLLLRHSLPAGGPKAPHRAIPIPDEYEKFDIEDDVRRKRSCRPRCVCRVVLEEEEGDGSDSKLVHCTNGRLCGSWIHPVCFHMDPEDEVFNDDADEYVCAWCETGKLPEVRLFLRAGSPILPHPLPFPPWSERD